MNASHSFAFSHVALRILLASIALGSACVLPSVAKARESLGLYDQWGAFRDPVVPRCYAVAMADPDPHSRDTQPYATVATWPGRGIRNQFHLRLSRNMAAHARITLRLDGSRFALTGGGADAWAANPSDNVAILAAMRSADTMTVSSRDTKGRLFFDRWHLAGAASAMDAAMLGCADLH